MTKSITLLFACLLSHQVGWAVPQNNNEVAAPDVAATADTGYVSVNVENVVVDTAGLVSATSGLSDAIVNLSGSITKLSQNPVALGQDDRAALLQAANSVQEASEALSLLAKNLPAVAQRSIAELSQAIENAHQAVADLSAGVQSASAGLIALTESLPEATEKGKQLIDAATQSVMVKTSTYTTIFFILLTLALVAVLYAFYKFLIAPILACFDQFTIIPSQIAEMTSYMKATSDNLVKMEAMRQPPQADPLAAPTQKNGEQ